MDSDNEFDIILTITDIKEIPNDNNNHNNINNNHNNINNNINDDEIQSIIDDEIDMNFYTNKLYSSLLHYYVDLRKCNNKYENLLITNVLLKQQINRLEKVQFRNEESEFYE